MPDLNQPQTATPKTLTTVDAARELNRRPQTLRKWACEGTGPIRPVRIFGRLHWKTADIERLLTEGA